MPFYPPRAVCSPRVGSRPSSRGGGIGLSSFDEQNR
jgi:hypothetical protein